MERDEILPKPVLHSSPYRPHIDINVQIFILFSLIQCKPTQRSSNGEKGRRQKGVSLLFLGAKEGFYRSLSYFLTVALPEILNLQFNVGKAESLSVLYMHFHSLFIHFS